MPIQGKLDIAGLLIMNGAAVNVATVDGKTALHLASLHGHTEVVKLLLEHDAETSAEQKTVEYSLYCTAADDAVRGLLSQQAAQALAPLRSVLN